jgi:hypothetical protein
MAFYQEDDDYTENLIVKIIKNNILANSYTRAIFKSN